MDGSFRTANSRLKFYCECGQRLNAPAHALGKPARCPKCRRTFNIPAGEPAASLHAVVGGEGSQILSALRPVQD